MRFATFGSYVPPTPPAPLEAMHAAVIGPTIVEGLTDQSLQWDTSNMPSGESGIIILGGSPNKAVRLTQLLISWSGLEIAGRLEVSTNPDKPLCVLFQAAPSGTLTVPLTGSPIIIGTYGLRCSNNSDGGEYAVTAYYHLEAE